MLREPGWDSGGSQNVRYMGGRALAAEHVYSGFGSLVPWDVKLDQSEPTPKSTLRLGSPTMMTYQLAGIVGLSRSSSLPTEAVPTTCGGTRSQLSREGRTSTYFRIPPCGRDRVAPGPHYVWFEADEEVRNAPRRANQLGTSSSTF